MTTTTLSALDQGAILASLPEALFQTGGAIAAALKAAGYDESATRVIDQLVWWGMTVGELAAELAGQARTPAGYVAHDGRTIWGFGQTAALAMASASEYLDGRFDLDWPDSAVDPCGPRLWESRESLLDPSSGWSVGEDRVVELD